MYYTSSCGAFVFVVENCTFVCLSDSGIAIAHGLAACPRQCVVRNLVHHTPVYLDGSVVKLLFR